MARSASIHRSDGQRDLDPRFAPAVTMCLRSKFKARWRPVGLKLRCSLVCETDCNAPALREAGTFARSYDAEEGSFGPGDD